MKKGLFLSAVLLLGLMATGCGEADSKSMVYVEEIPIETQENNAQEPSSLAEDTVGREVVQNEKEPYEEIEVRVNGDKGVINVGTTGAPFTEVLTQAKIQLAQEGWDLQIQRYDDYQKLNEDVLGGTLDAHLFAHQTYIDSYNDVNTTELTVVAPICYEVYGVYSELNEDLTKISGSIVGIPQDAPGNARALLYMNDLEWIVLKENVGMTAVMEDIEENTMNLQFVEYTQDTLLQVIKECDYCIIGADMAIMEGLDIEEGAIRLETKDNSSAMLYSTLLVTTQDKVSDEKMLALVSALTSQETKDYAKEVYAGALDFMR